MRKARRNHYSRFYVFNPLKSSAHWMLCTRKCPFAKKSALDRRIEQALK